MYFVQGGIILVLAGMVYQDFKYRGIYWWLFPLLLALIVLESYLSVSFSDTVKTGVANVFFVLVQVLLLSAYISLRTGRLTNIFKGYLGLGDLLFLISISFCFSFLNYIVFYLLSLMLVVLLTLLFRKAKEEKIPLAGYQALLLILILTVSHFTKGIDLRVDISLFKLMPYGN